MMEEFVWTITNESKLLEAMVGYKPVGVNKNFAMLCIWEKLGELNFDISSEKIWSHLKTMYNLEVLNENESLPFPNDEREFYLPELEFGAMKVKKEEKTETKQTHTTIKRNELKETVVKPIGPVKDTIKKENVAKKDQRRDSKDGKEIRPNSNIKKEVKKEQLEVDKSKQQQTKSRNSISEDRNRIAKRPLRSGSTKPEDLKSPSLKGQSPLTITPTSNNKRRRI